jgi:hypothetical protein
MRAVSIINGNFAGFLSHNDHLIDKDSGREDAIRRNVPGFSDWHPSIGKHGRDGMITWMIVLRRVTEILTLEKHVSFDPKVWMEMLTRVRLIGTRIQYSRSSMRMAAERRAMLWSGTRVSIMTCVSLNSL